jgi:hypothetical protein
MILEFEFKNSKPRRVTWGLRAFGERMLMVSDQFQFQKEARGLVSHFHSERGYSVRTGLISMTGLLPTRV